MPRDAVTSESCSCASCVVSVTPRYNLSSVRVAYVGGAGLAASNDDGGVVSMTAPLAVQYQNHTPAVLAVNDESYTPVEVCVTAGEDVEVRRVGDWRLKHARADGRRSKP